MPAHVHQFLCLSDNYGVLLHDPETRATATIDVPEAAPVLKALDEKGWEPHRHPRSRTIMPITPRAFPR